MKPLKPLLAVLLALVTFSAAAPSAIAAPPTPKRMEDKYITGSGPYKWPSVTAGGGRVYVTWGREKSKAVIAERAEESGRFTLKELSKESIGNASYFNAVVARGADGTVHAAWAEQISEESSDSRILYRKRPAEGRWTDPRIIVNGGFNNALRIAVRGSDEVFIAFGAPGGLAFAYSPNRGKSWPTVASVNIPSGIYGGVSSLGAGPEGAFLAWTGTRGGGDGQAFVARWNSRRKNFDAAQITFGGVWFFPTVSVPPAGQPSVVMTPADGRGIYRSVRKPSGSWPTVTRIFGQGGVVRPVLSDYDSQGNFHLAWLRKRAENQFEVYYSIKTPDEGFSKPLLVATSAFAANVDLAVSARTGYVLAHIVLEDYSNGQRIRYIRVRTVVLPPLATSE